MLWVVLGVVLALAAAAWWALRRLDSGTDELDKEVAGFALEPRYEELRKEYEAGRIPFDRMMFLRQLELQAARILSEFKSRTIPQDQVAVIEPQSDLDRQAFELLAERGHFQALSDGQFAWNPKPSP